MAVIVKIVMLCLCLKIDAIMATGCNQASSDCIKSVSDNTVVEKFQKMFCPIQKRFLHCWEMCSEIQKTLYYSSFQKFRGSTELCDENGQHVNKSFEIAKCITDNFYHHYLSCAIDFERVNRSPTKHLARNEGWINAIIYKNCVEKDITKQCGSDANDLLLYMKSLHFLNTIIEIRTEE